MDRPDFVWTKTDALITHLIRSEKLQIAKVAGVKTDWEDTYVLCEYANGAWTQALRLKQGFGYCLVPKVGPSD